MTDDRAVRLAMEVARLTTERDALREVIDRVEMVENSYLACASIAPDHMRDVFLGAASDLRAALDGPA